MTIRTQLGAAVVLLTIAAAPVRPGAQGAHGQPSAAELAAEAQVLALEQSMWEAEKAGTMDTVADRLPEDFLQIDSGGMMDRSTALKAMSTMRGNAYTLNNVRVLRLSNDAAIVTLEYSQQMPGRPEDHGYAASTWANRDGKWMNVLYVSVDKKK